MTFFNRPVSSSMTSNDVSLPPNEISAYVVHREAECTHVDELTHGEWQLLQRRINARKYVDVSGLGLDNIQLLVLAVAVEGVDFSMPCAYEWSERWRRSFGRLVH